MVLSLNCNVNLEFSSITPGPLLNKMNTKLYDVEKVRMMTLWNKNTLFMILKKKNALVKVQIFA